MTATTEALGRWGDSRFILRRDPDQCRYCGKGGPGGDHEATVCRACGMRVCLNPTSRWCPICYVGILEGYADNPATCGYKHCAGTAVARAPRVQAVCRDHLDRPKPAGEGGKSLGEYIRERAEGVRRDGYPYAGKQFPFVWTEELGR